MFHILIERATAHPWKRLRSPITNPYRIKRSSPERYAFLTEEQVTVLMTYSQNTEKVRSCKRKLVKAFAKAKKLLEGVISTQWEEELNIGSCPSVKERLENISLGMDLLEDLGGWDEKTGRLLKEQVRNMLLADRWQPAQKGISSHQSRLEYSILDRAISLGYFPDSIEREQIRKKTKKLYLERYGAEPIKRKQFINGDTQLVNHYGFNDLDILDEAIALVMDKK